MTPCRNSVNCAVSAELDCTVSEKRGKVHSCDQSRERKPFLFSFFLYPPPTPLLQTCHSAARNCILMLIAALHHQPRPALCTRCTLFISWLRITSLMYTLWQTLSHLSLAFFSLEVSASVQKKKEKRFVYVQCGLNVCIFVC